MGTELKDGPRWKVGDVLKLKGTDLKLLVLEYNTETDFYDWVWLRASGNLQTHVHTSPLNRPYEYQIELNLMEETK